MGTSNTLDPAATLATSMHAQPGMYALLLGSGVSRAADIPTGWQIVSELVARVAAVTSPTDIEATRANPEGWWREHHDGELGYSTLLEQLAPTPAGRQALVDQFFDRSDEEDDEDVKRPTAAHRAIAQLIKRGSVQVVLTTNFDRLLEDALVEVGVIPTVLARPEAVAGMAPLVRGGVTIVKLHGDRKDVTTLNTEGELSAYSPEWEGLLARIFDEYGLVIAGWSADWDPALVRAIENAPSRRYPLYWDGRSSRGGTAQGLISARAGQVIPAPDANALFTTLLDNLEALDRLARPPLTAAMAQARLKRYLPDPVRRIDLHDLVMDEVETVAEAVASQPVSNPDVVRQLGTNLDAYSAAADTLLRLLTAGVWHDDGTHDDLWVEVLQRLIDAGTTTLPSAMTVLEHARRYPALLAALAMGMTGAARSREGLILRLLTEPHGRTQMGSGVELPTALLLDYSSVLEHAPLNDLLKQRTGSGWTYPASHLVQEVLARTTEGFIPQSRFLRAFHGVEYRWGLVEVNLPGNRRPLPGEHIGETAKYAAPRTEDGYILQTEIDFRSSRNLDPWIALWTEHEGQPVDLDDYLIAHREKLNQVTRW